MSDLASHRADEGHDDQEQMTDHMYDGIQEYDNPLPGWWKNLFLGTFLFSIAYWAYFETGVPGRSIHDELTGEIAAKMEVKFKDIGVLEINRENVLKYMKDSEWMEFAKSTFEQNCISCHGRNGEGAVGPNLTDDYWKNVKNVEDIAYVIADGAGKGAMPSWKNQFTHPSMVVLTAAYVATLRDNPVPGKAAEGNKLPAWE
jgi:cytochrome c oxidase cbb3-type subunit 3